MDDARIILGLDIGSTRIGVASSRFPGGIPTPMTVLSNDDELCDNLATLIKENNVSLIVAGVPRSLSGNATSQTEYTYQVIERLRQQLPVKIYEQDEAVTSLHAEEELKSRKEPYSRSDIDSLSAVYILEDFMRDSLRRKVA